jgi:hypothetical protein
MADTYFNTLPLIAPNQEQKHITHNEALVKLDALIQLSAASQTLTVPPGSPAEGDRYIVAAGATGAWAGKTGNLALWTNGAWAFYVPRAGWTCYIAATSNLWAYSGSAWVAVTGGGSAFPDSTFEITDNADATKKMMVELSGITTGNTRILTVPNVSGTLALLDGGAQTFSTPTIFSAKAQVNLGLNVNPAAGDITSPVDGDVWYNSTLGKFRGRQAGSSLNLVTNITVSSTAPASPAVGDLWVDTT